MTAALVAFATAASAGEIRRSADPVKGVYIVVLHDAAAAGAFDDDAAAPGVAEVAGELLAGGGAEITAVWTAALKGFAVRLDEDRAKAISDDPRVAWVEEDGVAYANATQSPTPSWGLDRIDQRNLPLSNSYTYNRTGSGSHVYVIDTGILTTHTEFTGRIGNGFDVIGGGVNDCNGHGTFMAGVAAGTKYGVAKGAIVHPVRVLNCQGSGTWTQVISGIDWVRLNHIKPAVANLSIGGSLNTSLNTAVANMIAAGVSAAVAAGGSNGNTCNYSPASVATAVTVGATTNTDARAPYSNYGTCLDLFAPGSSITSAWYTSTTASTTISGTSPATAHVAGVIARYLQSNPGASAATVSSWLNTNATVGVVTNAGTGSPNRLLYAPPTL